ncbi:oligosaccharide flippase family protein [Chitinophagaceae bacterium MMS25-I14]
MKGRLFKDISFNLLQTVFAQLTGIVTFYITSRYLVKTEYGEINWVLAIGTLITTIACMGLDMTLVKKIAEQSISPQRLFRVHYFHTLVSSSLLLIAAYVFIHFSPGFSEAHGYFLPVFAASVFLYLSNSYKLTLTGLRRFKKTAIISICGNLVKFIGIPLLLLTGRLSVAAIAATWILSSAAEFAAAVYTGAFGERLGLLPGLDKELYKRMLVISLPVFGAIIFDSILAKIDWILMGVFSSPSLTADYIFAYKVFELAKLPLMVIAPLFLPYLAGLFSKEHISIEQKNKLQTLLRGMMAVAVVIPLLLDLCWSELFEKITAGKYGNSNYMIFFILSFCVPLHYITNFMYSKCYALGKLKAIMWSTFVVSSLNLLLNCILIPRMGGTGAAIAFLAATLVQVGIYIAFAHDKGVKTGVGLLLPPLVFGAIAFIAGRLCGNIILSLSVALVVYLLLNVVTGYVNIRSWIKMYQK